MLAKTTKVFTFILSLSLLQTISAGIICHKENGGREFEIDAGIYTTSANLYVPLSGKSISHFPELTERQQYGKLLLPHFPGVITFSARIHPLATSAIPLRAYLPSVYHLADITEEINLVRAFTAPYQEPYSLGFLWAKTLEFIPDHVLGEKGKASHGLVVNTGTHHIKNNVLVQAPWVESGWTFRGDISRRSFSHEWDFQITAKIFKHHDISDLLTLGAKRKMKDYGAPWHSLLRNGGFDTKVQFDLATMNLARFSLVYEKRFPIKPFLVSICLGIGVAWEESQLYMGSLAESGWKKGWRIVVAPDIIF